MSRNRFIRVLQKDIVTNPERWKDAGPGKFIKLPDRAKKVYCVLCVIAFSAKGNAEGKYVKRGGKLDKNWFWTSHAILQQLTGGHQKTVQRAIKELQEAGFIGYHPAKKNGHQCFFKIRGKFYNNDNEDVQNSRVEPKTVQGKKPSVRHEVGTEEPDLPTGNDNYIRPVKKETSKLQRPVKKIIPYEGVLFQTDQMIPHPDYDGLLLDKDGNSIIDTAFTYAGHLLESDGEEACLKYVAEENIEEHLLPKYQEKLAEMKKAQSVKNEKLVN